MGDSAFLILQAVALENSRLRYKPLIMKLTLTVFGHGLKNLSLGWDADFC